MVDQEKDDKTQMVQGEASRAFKKPKREVSDNLPLKELLMISPAIGNMEELGERLGRLISRENKIQGLEQKMVALVQETKKEMNFNNLEEETYKKSICQWLRRKDKGDDAISRTLEGIKNAAASHGVNFTRLLVAFMSDDEGMKKMSIFIASLRWVIEGEKSVVIRRILHAVDMAEKASEKKGKATIVKANIDKDIYLLQLHREILCFEYFWMHKGLPNSEILLAGSFSSIVADLTAREKELKRIESQVYDVKGTSQFESQDFWGQYKELDSRINELWRQIDEAEVKPLIRPWIEAITDVDRMFVMGIKVGVTKQDIMSIISTKSMVKTHLDMEKRYAILKFGNQQARDEAIDKLKRMPSDLSLCADARPYRRCKPEKVSVVVGTNFGFHHIGCYDPPTSLEDLKLFLTSFRRAEEGQFDEMWAVQDLAEPWPGCEAYYAHIGYNLKVNMLQPVFGDRKEFFAKSTWFLSNSNAILLLKMSGSDLTKPEVPKPP